MPGGQLVWYPGERLDPGGGEGGSEREVHVHPMPERTQLPEDPVYPVLRASILPEVSVEHPAEGTEGVLGASEVHL